MIKKACLVAIPLVLLAILPFVIWYASGVDANGICISNTTVVATTRDANDGLIEIKETTEFETYIPTTDSPAEEIDVSDESIEEITKLVALPASGKSYEDDLYYLAAAVCNEAGSSSEEIQLLVANVIINRVNSSLYPDTIYDVLTDYRQYGMMWKYGVSFPKWADQKTIDHCYDIARRILEGERVCPDNVLFQAEFEQGTGIYKQFEGFYFCYYG